MDTSVDKLPYSPNGEWYHEGDEVQIEWQILNKCTVENPLLEEIVPTHLVSPWEFYGVDKKISQALDTMELELNDWASQITENPQLKQFRDQLHSGLIVACKHEDEYKDRWVRAQIIGEDGDNYQVNLVDSGAIKTVVAAQLLPIKTEFVRRLPFQAIKFSMAHIKPTGTDEKWDNDTVEYFRYFWEEELTLNVGVLRDSPSTDEKWQSYEAIVFIGQTPVCQNLVQRQMAVYREDADVSRVLTEAQALLNAAVRNEPADEDWEDWEENPVVHDIRIVLDEPSPPNMRDFSYYSGTEVMDFCPKIEEVNAETMSLVEMEYSPPESKELEDEIRSRPRLPSKGFKGKDHRHQRYWQ